jgi:urea transporter
MAALAASTPAALAAFMAASPVAGPIVAGLIVEPLIAAAPIVVGSIVAAPIAVAVRSSLADAAPGRAVMAGRPAERSPPAPPSAS